MRDRFFCPRRRFGHRQKVRRCQGTLVLATTGFEPHEQAEIRELAKQIPLLWSPSMSMTVNLTMKLVEIAGRALANHPTGADVEILERHHRFKEDSPSGTALKFGQIVGQAMGSPPMCMVAAVVLASDHTTRSVITRFAPVTIPARYDPVWLAGRDD